jgi:hypothetical protein
LAAVGALFAFHAQAQYPGVPPASPVTLTTQYTIAGPYQTALEKLDAFYEEQVGRKGAVAFPEVAAMRHFDIWHDIWVSFEPAGDKLLVTMKRPADNVTNRPVRGWMLDIAGRIGADLPLSYQESAPMGSIESDLYASRRDVAWALRETAGMKQLTSWQHQGLFVSASPTNMVVLSAAGLHGVHHVTVSAETAAAARQLLAKLSQGALRPCVCAAYSETAELAAEIQKEAQSRADTIGVSRSSTIYIPLVDTRYLEERLRANPEMQKRVAAAAGYFDIKYRVDKQFAKVTIAWSELEQYQPADGSSQGERPLGTSTVASPRMPGPTALLNARTKLEPLKPGVYRVRLTGQPAAGEPVVVDDRIFSFDGKNFEEM